MRITRRALASLLFAVCGHLGCGGSQTPADTSTHGSDAAVEVTNTHDANAMTDTMNEIDVALDAHGADVSSDVPTVTDADHRVPTQPSVVMVSGRQVLVQLRNPDGSLATAIPYDIKGVAWSPYGPGEAFDGAGHNTSIYAAQDGDLMHAAHINTIRTYGPFERNDAGLAALDEMYRRGIMVAMTVFAGYDETAYLDAVMRFRNHPAVLMWLVGNEWNYNHLYTQHTQAECAARVSEVIAAIHAMDANHPVATVYGEIPSAVDYASVSTADLWGANVYPSLDFADRFTRWRTLSTKPIFISEYGADAYHRNGDGSGAEDQTSQSVALQMLTTQIRANLSALDSTHVCVGGFPFAWNDEWWKSGNPAGQDNDGFANGGVYSDGFANEEWWGIVDAMRTPRLAYRTLTTLYQ